MIKRTYYFQLFSIDNNFSWVFFEWQKLLSFENKSDNTFSCLDIYIDDEEYWENEFQKTKYDREQNVLRKLIMTFEVRFLPITREDAIFDIGEMKKYPDSYRILT